MIAGRSSRRACAWVLWVALGVLAASGLGHHRVDNDLGTWMPALIPEGTAVRWAVIGLGPHDPAPTAVAAALRQREEVGVVVDPESTTLGQRFGGPDPDGLTGRPGDPMTATWVFAAEGHDDAALVAAVESVLAEAGAPVPSTGSTPRIGGPGDPADGPALAGPAVFHVALDGWSQAGLDRISGLQWLSALLLILLFTGRVIVALAGATAIALVQLVILGIFAWHRTPLDLSLSLVPPLVAALGASFVMHQSMRPRVGRLLIACAVTTMIGIGTFAFGGLLPLLRFGTWGAFGIGLAAAAVWMLVPGPRAPENQATPGVLDRFVVAATVRSRSVAVVLLLVVLGGAALLAPGLRTVEDPLRDFPADARIRHDFERLDAAVAGMLPFEITVDGAFDPRPAVLATPGVRRLTAAPDRPGTWWGLASNGAVPAIRDATPAWRAAAAEAGAELEVRGVAAILAAVGETVRAIALGSIPMMFLVAAVACGMAGRSWKAALAGGAINAVPAAALVWVAVLGRIELGLPALLVGAITTGVAIDDSLHVCLATRRLGSGAAAVASCGPACIASSIVAAAGVSLFMLSPFGPVNQFGQLMAASMIAATLADVLLLPALLAGDAHATAAPQAMEASP